MKKSMYFLIFLLVFFSSAFSENYGKIIIITGASCSGKSTIARKFLDFLDQSWFLIELDTTEDKYKTGKIKDTEDDLMIALIQGINELTTCGYNVIFDTSIYDETLFSFIKTDYKKVVFVDCPRSILFERNRKRDKVLRRSEESISLAKAYIEETSLRFSSFDQYDLCIRISDPSE